MEHLKLKGDLLKQLIDSIDMRPSKIAKPKDEAIDEMSDDSMATLHSASEDADDVSAMDDEAMVTERHDGAENPDADEDGSTIMKYRKSLKSGKGREAPLD